MSTILVATLIVASFLGGGVFWLSGRAGADSWLALTLGLLVYGLALHAGPALWGR